MRPLGYVSALDGIRGLAIAGVIAAHYYGSPATGAMGVDLFFVLSGFLITTLLLEERDRTGSYSLRRFYARRARRLLPALAVLLIVYASVRGRAGLEPALLGASYVSNFLMAFSGHFYRLLEYAYLGQLWSLAAEEQFYALWPLLLPLLLRSRHRLPLLLLFSVAYDMAIVATHAGGPRVSFGPDLSVQWLLGGACLALYRRSGRRIPTVVLLAALGLIAARAAVVPLVSDRVLYEPMILLAFVCLVAGAYQGGTLGRLLSFSPLVWLGRISYSLYLWHAPVVFAIGWDHVTIALVLTLLISWLSYRYVETPFRHGRARKVPAAAAGPAAGALDSA